MSPRLVSFFSAYILFGSCNNYLSFNSNLHFILFFLDVCTSHTSFPSPSLPRSTSNLSPNRFLSHCSLLLLQPPCTSSFSLQVLNFPSSRSRLASKETDLSSITIIFSFSPSLFTFTQTLLFNPRKFNPFIGWRYRAGHIKHIKRF